MMSIESRDVASELKKAREPITSSRECRYKKTNDDTKW